eukprot:m51a1_g1588 putative zinc transporter zip1 (334) ;mRNA; f:144475-145476
MNALLLLKIVCAVVDPIETALGALIPVCLRRTSTQNADRLVAVSMAAAAGIFLSVGLCHMADDATEFLSSVTSRLHGFPLPLFLVCCGFALMLALEKVVFGHGHHHHHHSAPAAAVERAPDCGDPSVQQDKCPAGPDNDIDGEQSPLIANSEKELGDTGAPEAAAGDHKGRAGACGGHARSEWEAYVKAGAMTLGIMLHSGVSGLAIGVARDMATLTAIVVATVAHDWSHACALVVLYDELRLPARAQVLFLAAVVAVEPLCIGVGIAVVDALSDSSAMVVSGALSGVAAGVFVYIAVVELVHEAFEEPHDQLLKFVVFFLFTSGIAAVAAIA